MSAVNMDRSGAVGTDDVGGISYVAVADDVVVTLWGEIDVALRGKASEAMAFVIDHQGTVTIDVAEVAFIDSAGIAFILQLYALCLEEGRGIALRNPTEAIEELFEMIGMAGRIPIQRTSLQAILAAQRPLAARRRARRPAATKPSGAVLQSAARGGTRTIGPGPADSATRQEPAAVG